MRGENLAKAKVNQRRKNRKYCTKCLITKNKPSDYISFILSWIAYSSSEKTKDLELSKICFILLVIFRVSWAVSVGIKSKTLSSVIFPTRAILYSWPFFWKYFPRARQMLSAAAWEGAITKIRWSGNWRCCCQIASAKHVVFPVPGVG